MGMSDVTTNERQVFEAIAPQSWEHPADRAALQTLRMVPGFDQIVRRTIGFFGEGGIRTTFQANAVRVGPRQFPSLYRLMHEVQRTLDWHEEIPLFVSQAPWFNAGAYGLERPFIVLHSATIDLLEEHELRVLLGHELGHVMSGHALYRTMLALILAFGLRNMPFLMGYALLPTRLALQEWSRKSELSSDRAALLASQNADHALSMFLKAAGGTITRREALNLDAYKEQVADYQHRVGMDTIFKLLNLLDQTHPTHTLRAAELIEWAQSDAYRRILGGEYRRRTDGQTSTSYGADMGEAASYYANEAKARAGEVTAAAKVVFQQTQAHAKRAAVEAGAALRSAAEGTVARLQEALRRKRPVHHPH
jgi:Zn-dependent protease with chaperone function